MSVVKINAITVPEGSSEELERRFAARAGSVEKSSGFLGFKLLRPTGGDQRYFNDHVHQAGSYVGHDKLRFDFTHGAPLSDEDRAWVEDRVNEQVLANDPVRALTTTLDEAKALGAMALFGEKYGDVVRMVEIGDGRWSRELCGGTHVRSTAEISVARPCVAPGWAAQRALAVVRCVAASSRSCCWMAAVVVVVKASSMALQVA